MKQLDGAWEPRGYFGPRAEIRGKKIILLWRGAPVLSTTFTVKEEEGALVLCLKDREKRYEPSSAPYATVVDCRLAGDGLTVTEDFPITGKSSDTRYGAFVPDREALRRLKGTWVCGDGRWALSFRGDRMTEIYSGSEGRTVQIVALRSLSDPEDIRVTDPDPSRDAAGDFAPLRLRGDTLTTAIPVCDAPSVQMVFVKK